MEEEEDEGSLFVPLFFSFFFYVPGIPVFYTALFSQLGTPLLCLGSLLFFFLINRIFFFFLARSLDDYRVVFFFSNVL